MGGESLVLHSRKPGLPGGAEEALYPLRKSSLLAGRALGAAVGEVERRAHPNSSRDLKEDIPSPTSDLHPTPCLQRMYLKHRYHSSGVALHPFGCETLQENLKSKIARPAAV